MQKPGSHEAALARFRAGEVKILLGTQMIAKGLDFPNVTLVGVVNADTTLHFCDLRAAERTFQLVTQVAGRTGRGDKGGRVLVQTFSPDHYAILAAIDHDYARFAAAELPIAPGTPLSAVRLADSPDRPRRKRAGRPSNSPKRPARSSGPPSRPPRSSIACSALPPAPSPSSAACFAITCWLSSPDGEELRAAVRERHRAA